jgi:hypothetical protein
MSDASFTAGTASRQALIVAEFIPHPRGTLRGFVNVAVGGITLVGCRVIVKPDGRAWVQAASSVQVDAAGNTLRGSNGWPIRERVVSFGSREAERAWSDEVIRILRTEQPEALA